MQKLLVLTDLHMTPEGVTIIGLDPARRLAAAVDFINARHADAERLVVLGDLAHRGDAPSYRRLAEILGRLRVPLSITIGNHDHRATFRAAFPQVPVDAAGFVQSAFDAIGHRVILLDTAHEGTHAGRLCDDRLAWLDAELARAGDRPVIIGMHHPAHLTGIVAMDAIRLEDEDRFLEVLRRHGNVRQILAGHVHRTIGGSVAGIPFFMLKSNNHQGPLDFESPDSSLSVDEPAALGVVIPIPGGLVVHSEDYELAARAEPISERQFR